MKNEIAIKALEEKIESLSANANKRKQRQEVDQVVRGCIVEKQEVEIWFRWNDGTLGEDKTVKVASATYENQDVDHALRSIYSATQNDFGSWVDSVEENGLTLHVPARNEDGISQGSSYVGDIIIINGQDMYEVADWGFNKISETLFPHVIEEFKNEVVFGRDEEARHAESRSPRHRRLGWNSSREYYDSGIQDLESAIRDLKKED